MTDSKVYYGSEEEEDMPGPTKSLIPPPIEMKLPKQPDTSDYPVTPNDNNKLFSKLNELNNKIDNLIGRVATLEQGQRAILDTVMEIKRSFPRFTSIPPTQTLGIDRKLL